MAWPRRGGAAVVTDLRAESVYHASFTTQVQGRVRVEIDASSDADRLVLYSDGVEVWRGARHVPPPLNR